VQTMQVTAKPVDACPMKVKLSAKALQEKA
jgi:hypothetical protein